MNGQVTIKGVRYTVVLAYAAKMVSVSLIHIISNAIFSCQSKCELQEIKRQAPVETTYTQLTGFEKMQFLILPSPSS